MARWIDGSSPAASAAVRCASAAVAAGAGFGIASAGVRIASRTTKEEALLMPGPSPGRLPRLVARLFALAALAALSGIAATGSPASSAGDPAMPQLEMILARLARVAELYRDRALRFTCDESIYYTGHAEPVVHRFRYIYRHEEGKLHDYRVPRGRAARRSDAKNEEIALANYGLPTYLLRAYSWIFIFAEENRSRFRFEREGPDRVFGRPAVRVRFEGIPPFDEEINVWFGTAWVDRESSQLLQIEALHAKDHAESAAMDAALAAGGDDDEWAYRPSYTFATYRTEFDEEKNGLRFPSRVLIRRTEHAIVRRGAGWAPLPAPIYLITQTYKKYRFFGVRTAEEIESIVLGRGGASAPEQVQQEGQQ